MAGRAVLLLLVAAAGCGGRSRGENLPPVSDVLKIAIFRAYRDPRTKKPAPTYRAVMTDSWREQIGESPRDPFAKASPGNVYKGFLADRRVRRIYEELVDLGLHTLRASGPDDYAPQDLHDRAVHPTEGPLTRILVVGTDEWTRCFLRKDQILGGDEGPARIFADCERFVLKLVSSNTILVRTRGALFRR